MVKAVTQTAPDVEIGWSRRRHASRRRSGGVRHSSNLEWTMEVAMVEVVLKSSMGPMRRKLRMCMKQERERLEMLVIVIVNSKLLKRPSKAKRRAPVYSRALRQIRGVFQRIVRGRLRSVFQRVRECVKSEVFSKE